MIIDLHAHSSGISRCCKAPYNIVIDEAISVGLDGFVLTNHYQKSYIENNDINALVDKYINEFHSAKEYGDSKNFKVYFGIEVTMEQYPMVHLLIYGVPFDFLRENPEIFSLTQQELYKLVKSYGGILVQAHPFRNGTTVLDTRYLDGVEINCHPNYDNTHSERLIDIARENNLILTCGGDFHYDNYRPKCGIFVPDNIGNSIELGNFLKSTNKSVLYVQEINSNTTKEISFKRGR